MSPTISRKESLTHTASIVITPFTTTSAVADDRMRLFISNHKLEIWKEGNTSLWVSQPGDNITKRLILLEM